MKRMIVYSILFINIILSQLHLHAEYAELDWRGPIKKDKLIDKATQEIHKFKKQFNQIKDNIPQNDRIALEISINAFDLEISNLKKVVPSNGVPIKYRTQLMDHQNNVARKFNQLEKEIKQR